MFITSTREKILRLYFDRPWLHIHLRGVARRAEVNPQNAHKYLQEFVQEGLLLKSESPQFDLYRLNPKNAPVFKLFELFELRRRDEFFASNIVLAQRLLKYMQILRKLSGDKVRIVVLHGPAARGEWTEGGEVHILTDSPAQKEAVDKVRHMFKISSMDMAVDNMKQGFRKKSDFFSALWRDRIVLYNEFLFWEMIRESQTSRSRVI